MVLLHFALWVVLGLLVGFIASKVVNLRGDDPKAGIILAAIAALFGGFVFAMFSTAGINNWNRLSLLSALFCAVIAVVAWHIVRSRYVSHAVQSTRRSY